MAAPVGVKPGDGVDWYAVPSRTGVVNAAGRGGGAVLRPLAGADDGAVANTAADATEADADADAVDVVEGADDDTVGRPVVWVGTLVTSSPSSST